MNPATSVLSIHPREATATHGTVHLVEVDGVTHRVSRDEGGVLRSPMPALVVATPLEAGAEVVVSSAISKDEPELVAARKSH